MCLHVRRCVGVKMRCLHKQNAPMYERVCVCKTFKKHTSELRIINTYEKTQVHGEHIYIYIYIYIYIHTHIHTHIYKVYASFYNVFKHQRAPSFSTTLAVARCVCVCMYVSMHVCTYLCMYVYVYVHERALRFIKILSEHIHVVDTRTGTCITCT